MISTAIQQLVNYGLDTGLILPDDEIYIRNQLLMTMQLDDFTAPEGEVCYTDLESILKTLVDDAVARGVCEDNSTARDLFDTKLMGVLTPRPSIVRANFEERYESEGPQAATDWFYKFSQDTDYIRRYRIKRDLKWVTKTPYGDLDITINLSKPEKDPKAIAAAKLAPQSAYPKCQLCAENEGYAGRMNHPARENHRIIPLTINDSAWNLQYSPYVYYNEHCIVFNNQHTPMKIERATFRKLLDFVGLFPHYFVGSNADLPIVGGSILSHDHFQGGHYEFAMAKAPVEKKWVFPGFEDQTTALKLPAIPVKNGVSETVIPYISKDFSYTLCKGESGDQIERRIEYKKDLTAPIRKGDMIGRIVYTMNNQTLEEIPVYAARNVSKATYTDCLGKLLKRWFVA